MSFLCFLIVGCSKSAPSPEEAGAALDADLHEIAVSTRSEVLNTLTYGLRQDDSSDSHHGFDGQSDSASSLLRFQLTSIGPVSEQADLRDIVDALAGLGYELRIVKCRPDETFGVFGRSDGGIKIWVGHESGAVHVEGQLNPDNRRVPPDGMDVRDDGEECWPEPS